MLKVARALITADRIGSWTLHLEAFSACLPIFAAAGHFNYLKSAYLYVQEMSNLHIKNPDVLSKFEKGYHVIRRSNNVWAGLGSDLVIEQTLMRSLKSTGGLTHGSGMTEEQRAIWTMSVPITAEYNNAMQELTGLYYTTSEQHKESSKSRIELESFDLQKIHSKLISTTLFSSDPLLRNIINGVCANNNVNVHEFKEVGKKIIEKMQGESVFTFSFKRRDRAITLGDESSIKITQDQKIDPALLFQRFLVVSKSGDFNLEDVMSYELSPFPSALFEAKNILRKADKAQLAHVIKDHFNDLATEPITEVIPQVEHYVIDGGSLLYRVAWKKGDTYGTIALSYAEFTIRHYGKATVVFDGYGGPSIKDNTHRRRGQNLHPFVNCTVDTEFSGKKEAFLSRDSNKQELINLISVELKKAGCNVLRAKGDADVDIVKAAISEASSKSTAVIGEDTDLLVILLYHALAESYDLFFYSDIQTKERKVFHINQIKLALGSELCSQLLFIHAFTGCDTTSRIYSIGKKTTFLKFLKSDSNLHDCASSFVLHNQSPQVIEEIGNNAMSLLFGGACNSSLGSLRCTTFRKKVVLAKSVVTPERLPPTSSSTKYHSYRVYYQIMVWIGSESHMNPEDWGWRLEDNQYIPIMTCSKPAPKFLLKMIRCKCTTFCITTRCSCRQYGLSCTPACGPCQLENCNNENSDPNIDDDDDDVEVSIDEL